MAKPLYVVLAVHADSDITAHGPFRTPHGATQAADAVRATTLTMVTAKRTPLTPPSGTTPRTLLEAFGETDLPGSLLTRHDLDQARGTGLAEHPGPLLVWVLTPEHRLGVLVGPFTRGTGTTRLDDARAWIASRCLPSPADQVPPERSTGAEALAYAGILPVHIPTTTYPDTGWFEASTPIIYPANPDPDNAAQPAVVAIMYDTTWAVYGLFAGPEQASEQWHARPYPSSVPHTRVRAVHFLPVRIPDLASPTDPEPGSRAGTLPAGTGRSGLAHIGLIVRTEFDITAVGPFPTRTAARAWARNRPKDPTAKVLVGPLQDL